MRPLGVLLPDGAPELPADTKTPRTELAKWITDPENPLTARVIVNRIWQLSFRARHREHAERFRAHGQPPVASGAARLAGQSSSSNGGWQHEAAASRRFC